MADESPAYRNVTLKTIDEAVVNWLRKTVAAQVSTSNGERKPIPVRFSSGERWVTSRERKGIRDENGVLILPIIAVRRSGIEPSVDQKALGTETSNITVAKRVALKTNDLNTLHRSRIPSRRTPKNPVVYEVFTIPFPHRSVLTYEIQVQTQYIGHMNSFLEKCVSSLDANLSFVAPFMNDGRKPSSGENAENRPPILGDYVVGFFDGGVSDAGNLEEFTDTERIVQFNTTIRVPVALQLDPDDKKSAIKVERTAFGIGFSEEKVTFLDNPADVDKIFGKLR